MRAPIANEHQPIAVPDAAPARRRRRSNVSLGGAFAKDGAADPAANEFLAMLSHELRTPLTVIRGNGALLRRDMDRLSEEERVQAIGDICAETERLCVLVDNLMTLAAGAGPRHLEDQLEPVNVPAIAQHVIARYRRQEPSRPIRSMLVSEPMPALGIPGYIEQILDNFIANAIKYSANTCPVDVIIGTHLATVEVRVVDRGVGIEPGEESRIFAPVFRSARGARMAAGSGIGLAVCRRLAEAQRGSVWALTRSGGGSEFGFSIPAALSPADDAA